MIKISKNTKAAPLKKKAAGIKLDMPGKNQEQICRLKGGSMSSYAISKATGISASTVAKYVSVG